MRYTARPSSAEASPGRDRRHHRLALALTTAFALLIAAALAPAGASAASHPFKETFGSASQPSFGEPKGMAVDQSTGDVLVINTVNKTVSRWHADGTASNFSALSSTNVIDGHAGEADEITTGPKEILGAFLSAGEVEVAVDNSTLSADKAKGDIYVTGGTLGVIDIFASTGAYLGQLTGFGEADGVAVDSSGAVYVSDAFGGVSKYVPTTNPPANTKATELTGVSEPTTLAAGAGPTAGSLFVHPYGGKVKKLNITSDTVEYELPLPTASEVVTVDPTSGRVYATSTEKLFEYDASGASNAIQVSETKPGSTSVEGIAVNKTTGNVYASTGGNHNVEVYGPNYLLKVEKPNGQASGSVAGVPGGIECTSGAGADCEEAYPPGITVTLTASPASGYAFTSMSGCTSVSGRTCTVEMTASKTVKATFTKTWPLTIEKAGSGTGKVTAVGISCDSGCTKAVSAVNSPPGKVKVSAILAGKASKFVGFESGTGNAVACAATPCEFTIGEASSLKAKFALIPTNPLTVNMTGPAAAKGTVKSLPPNPGISCSAGCSSVTREFAEALPAGEPIKVTLEATAASGYSFAKWTAGPCAESTSKTCEVPMNEGAKSLTAEFK